MLTEIEWWGGFLFLWLALSFWALFVAVRWVKYGFQFVYSVGAVLFPGIVLALYFYPLESLTSKYIYLGSYALGLLFTLLLAFWPESDDDAVVADITEDEEEEEGGETLGVIVLILPMAIALALGATKVLQIGRELGYLGT